MKTYSYRQISRSTCPRTLRKTSKVSDDQFNAFVGMMYETMGAQRVTGMVMLAAGGYVGVCDAEHIYYDPFWILSEPGNPRGIQDRDIVSVYGFRDRNGDFYHVGEVIVHKPGSKIYEKVMAL